jgi:NAD(P)-dependent dehydrogenase (short-subunit alcohol dehydrogenase family)
MRFPAVLISFAATALYSLRDECKGLRHIDVVINNAGIYGAKVDIKTVTEQDMMQTFKTNAIGPLIVVQQLLVNGLIGGFGGKTLVANVSSKVGSVDDNRGGGGYPYRASKSALNIVNKSMSIDLAGDGVTCVLLHPGEAAVCIIIKVLIKPY